MQIYARDHVEVHPQKKKEVNYEQSFFDVLSTPPGT